MKSRTAMVVLMLCAAVAVFGSEYEPTIASESSPLFAASLERAVSGLKGERPQRKSAANRAVRGAAAVAEDTSGWNCTQFEGCWSFVTQGGISCDYSLCEGCPGQTVYGNYTCSNVINCGVFPTQNAEPTCSGFGSTCGSGCSTAQHDNCNNTSSSFCGTFSGSTCASTCNVNLCPTSGGTSCATQVGSTCESQFCSEPTSSSNCEVPTHRPSCENTSGWGCEEITSTSLCNFYTSATDCTQSWACNQQ